MITGLGIDVVRIEPRQMKVPAALSNSFGFGGHNASIVVRAWDE